MNVRNVQSFWEVCGDSIWPEWKNIWSSNKNIFVGKITCVSSIWSREKLSLFLHALCCTQRSKELMHSVLLCKTHDVLFVDDCRLMYLSSIQVVQKYKLGNPRTFHYLNQSNCIELEGLDDGKEYLATIRAMDVVGISPEEQVLLFTPSLCCKTHINGLVPEMCSLYCFWFSGSNF